MGAAPGRVLAKSILDAVGIDAANVTGIELRANAEGVVELVVTHVVSVDSVEGISEVLRKYRIEEAG